jgi:apolipoprotein N-acyltransferase
VFPISDSMRVAPVICYESIFGGYLSKFFRQGANLIAVVTNDGWWGNTPGYQQHFAYSRLRAIEFRAPVLRSANTGISGFIDPQGRVVHRSGWWQPAVVRHQLPQPRQTLTLYARYGDSIGRLAAFLSVVFFLATLVQRIKLKGQPYLRSGQQKPSDARLN